MSKYSNKVSNKRRKVMKSARQKKVFCIVTDELRGRIVRTGRSPDDGNHHSSVVAQNDIELVALRFD